MRNSFMFKRKEFAVFFDSFPLILTEKMAKKRVGEE